MQLSKPSSVRFWILWSCAGAISIVMLPSEILFGGPAWSLSKQRLLVLVGTAVAYSTGALLLAARLHKNERVAWGDLLFTSIAAFGVYFFLLLVTKASYERPLLLAGLILAAIFLLVPFGLKESTQKRAIYIAASIPLLVHFLGNIPRHLWIEHSDSGPRANRSQRVIDSTLYAIRTSFYDHYFDICSASSNECLAPRNGGGISTFRNGYLVASGEGVIEFFALAADNKSLAVTRLPFRVPLNSDDFEAAGGGDHLSKFRVTDLLVQDKGSTFLLLAAHHRWKTVENCFVIRVSSAEASYEGFLTGQARIEWRTLYETEPCLPLNTRSFHGDESGGRLVLVDKKRVLLSVGDLSVDGLSGGAILSQDRRAAYGKTILIDLDTHVAKLYSMGHRNPQGLHVAADGTIWLTEHGPRGGDELNLLIQGENYGWPFATYGTHMLLHTWPLNTHVGEHKAFKRPVYAWLPDIGVSNLIVVKGELFEHWRGDLLVGSLKKVLFRVRIRGDSVVYVEPMEIRGRDARIRDIIEDQDGRIVLWLDGGSIAILEPVGEDKPLPEDVPGHQGMRGELLFARCLLCHNVGDGDSHGIGPDLSGIVDRRIAQATGYSYSRALANMKGTWSEGRLDQFLANPQHFAPGTSMQFEGIPDPADRARLIAYLKTL